MPHRDGVARHRRARSGAAIQGPPAPSLPPLGRRAAGAARDDGWNRQGWDQRGSRGLGCANCRAVGPPVAQRPGAAVPDHAVLGRQRHRRTRRRAGAAAGAVHPAALDRGAGDRGAARLALPAGRPAEAVGAQVDDPAARGAGRVRLQHPGLSRAARHHGGQRAAAAIRHALGGAAGQPAAVPGAAPADTGSGHRRILAGRAGDRGPGVARHAAAPAGQPRATRWCCWRLRPSPSTLPCCGGGRRCIRSASLRPRS